MEEIHPKELKKLMLSKKLILIDVRREEDCKKRSLKGAISMPIPTFDLEVFRDLQAKNKGIPTYLVCYRGISSFDLAEALEYRGFRGVCSVIGGMEKCEEEGMEMN
ncbi:MAG: Thiosulfate sulfurtransferase GlpE [Chlamydiia bacterium]|nr:Thiosulfate sulfurtransferase GlpE [Chlamydiia bacterium]